MNKFKELGLSSHMLEAIEKQGIKEPTMIQEMSIPHIMAGEDVIGESATGSGKTLAFGCGVVEHLNSGKGIQALILTPTRELAEQVKKSIIQLSYRKHLFVSAVYGGVSISPQIDDLRRTDIVVATPGRLLDHLQRNTINLSGLKILVLDEVDRMLDMGFIDDIEKILKSCPKKRQNLFFSATVSSKIQSLINKHTNNAVKVSATKQVDPSKLSQVYYNVQRNNKLSLLLHMLEKEKSGLVMVFCNTRRSTDFVVKNLHANKIKAIAIHGGLSQNKRTHTIKMFNDARVHVLVCTDVAARGLHIDNVSHIYNYEIPKDAIDYVHRIGRTARAGSLGKVVNLLSDSEHPNFSRIKQEYRDFNIKCEELPKLNIIRALRAEAVSRTNNLRNNFRGHTRRYNV